jgi:hypothetical protein
MKPLVFAGPSLFGVKHGSAPSLDFAPPAACGDIISAVRSGRTCIGLIDGVFESGPAVWHKEILFALEESVTVAGAASMGALRAAECWRFGMLGIGGIFEQYRSGARSSDADVAVSHAPAEFQYRPLSLAQIDVEHALGLLAANGTVSQDFSLRLGETSRNIFFKDRTWRSLFDQSRISKSKQLHLLAHIGRLGPLAKAADALKLLTFIETCPASGQKLEGVNRTGFFAQLLKSAEPRPNLEI